MIRTITRSMILVFLSLMLMSVSVKANDVKVLNAEQYELAIRAEQVEWKYRFYEGNLQKRLWSYTYGCWKTPWMNV